MENSAVNRNTLVTITPELAESTEMILPGDIWAHRDLSPCERSLIILLALMVLGKAQQLP